MSRIPPAPKLRLERMDVMLVAALSVILGSYALGYRMDWFEGQSWPEGDEVEVAAVAAPASTPPSQRPAPEMKEAAAPAVVMKEADPRDEVWERMVRDLSSAAARHPGRVAIMLKDLQTGRTWSYHPDDLFPSASLIKVPVMASAFFKIREGELGLSQKLTLRRRLRVGGSGSLKWRHDGTKYTVKELLLRMMTESDNTATAMILDELGIGYAQQAFPRMGLMYTGIYPEGMSIKGGRVKNENYTTAREMTMLMEKIYRGELVDRESSALMLEFLKKPKPVPARLAKGLPRGWKIAHKTGLLRQACHDTGIVFSPYGDYAITVLTGQNRSYSQAKDFIVRLGRITARHYTAYAGTARPAGEIAKGPRDSRQLAFR